jgi:hypothetical protein
MKSINRPTPITTILNTISSGSDAAVSTQLETYITDLEAKQPDRPKAITEILSMIGSRYTVDSQAVLESYIANLEAKQRPIKNQAAFDANNPPIWSQQRTAEREQHRHERALLKQMMLNDENRGKRES